MENSVGLVKLPELVILLISRHLSYEDLQNLRVTCKKLKEIIDRKTFQSLHLFVRGYPFERVLFHSGELISHANTFHVHVHELHILKSVKFKSQFIGLLKLTIYLNFDTVYLLGHFKPVDLNDLNCFQDLVHLEVRGSELGNGELNLRNLEIFFFSSFENPVFKLNCPRLKALGLACVTGPKLLTPETSNSIRHFTLRMRFNGTSELLSFYAKLKNLSSIALLDDQDLNTFLLAVLERRLCLPSLKEIHLKKMTRFSDLMFSNLAKLKSRYETRHIEVLINGKATASDELTEIFNLLKSIPGKPAVFYDSQQLLAFGAPAGNLLRHFIENPTLHCLLPGVFKLRLLSNEDVISGRQLIENFRNLRRLEIGKGIELDANFFECILKTCRKTSVFQLECARLKQRQLNQMPNYLRKLAELQFVDDILPEHLDFGFVAKFKNLRALEIGFNIEKETMSFLFENLKYEPIFCLRLCGKQRIWIFGGRFEIILGNKSVFNYRNNSNVKIQFDSIEDAIEHYYRNDLFNTPWVDSIETPEPINFNTIFRCSLI